jgi:RNA polymerase sigma-70 factor (sigma-E family)
MTGQAEFAAFFDEMYDRTVAVARRLTGDQRRAEDIAAETLTRAYVHWGRLHDDHRRAGWIVRVATNLAIDAARRRPAPRTSAAGTAVADDEIVTRVALVQAMRRLSRRERQVIALRYLADFSEADVAASLGLSVGSVKTYTARGLTRLRPLLSARTEHEVEGTLAPGP